jgi:hypothetical protein
VVAVVAAAVLDAGAAADPRDRLDPPDPDRRGRLVRLDVVWPCGYLVNCVKSVETTSSFVLKAKNNAGM